MSVKYLILIKLSIKLLYNSNNILLIAFISVIESKETKVEEKQTTKNEPEKQTAKVTDNAPAKLEESKGELALTKDKRQNSDDFEHEISINLDKHEAEQPVLDEDEEVKSSKIEEKKEPKLVSQSTAVDFLKRDGLNVTEMADELNGMNYRPRSSVKLNFSALSVSEFTV